MSERATFGAELRRLRRAAGVSLTEFAARTNYSKGYLSKIETGLALPNPAFAEQCERELQLTGALTALLPREPAKRRTRPDARLSGLPPATAIFTGRAAEFQAVRAALESDGGICVISGMGGVGKTALANRCAHRLEAAFADGCVWLDLRGYSPGEEADPAAVHDRLLRRLGEPAARIPSDPDDRAMVYQSRLRGRSLLLVLDNVSSAAQVRPLLPAEPKCRVLITSRSRLSSLDDTRQVTLDVLDTSEAAELFVSITGTSPGEVVTRVVERCAGLPLAIRILAARLQANPAWTVEELDDRLGAEADRLGELDDGERSLLAAFRLSLHQLAPAEARLFGLLALHPGADLHLDAATALGGLPRRETDRLLNRLHDACLLTQPSPDRYGFHDLLKLFAADVVTERDGAFRRLLDFSVQVAAHGDHLLTSRRFVRGRVFGSRPPEPVPLEDDEAALSWFRAEWRGLASLCRVAGERGEHERCWQLAHFLRGFFFTAKLWDPWIATHRWAKASAEALGDRWVLATTTANLGVAHVDSGAVEAAFTCYDEALALYRGLGDEHGENMTRAHRAWADHYRGRHAEALSDFQQAQAFYARMGNRRNAAITDRGIALVLIPLGRAAEGAALAASTLTAFDDLGLDLDAAMALNCLGWAWFHAGDHDRAAVAYHDAADRALACGSSYETARAYTGIGNIAAARGEHGLAADFWERADDVHADLNPLMVGETRIRWA
ncbi:NB-ARC domain-containing protein [Amycolatopsis sp. cg5]|uniref:ATP-binding protein n=1 Tax=Amycolatopsis sp. cg5 TaxID=3238802 RepID=UPI003524DDC6